MVSLKNPVLPLVHSVPHSHVNKGQKYVIKGHPLENANRFSINFVQASSMEKIFHLDFRFDQDSTVRNTNFPGGNWGSEERSANPLQKNRPFKIEIRVLDDRYHVEIDDHHHCDYHHRVASTNADAINVKGDVYIKSVKILD